MRNSRFMMVISLLLCGLLSVPVCADNTLKPVTMTEKVVAFLKRVDHAREVAGYAVVGLTGLVITTASAYFAVSAGFKSFKKKEMTSERHENLTVNVGIGSAFSLLGLGLIGYGARGIIKALEKKPDSTQASDEKIDAVVNGAKNVARYWVQFGAFTTLAILGVGATTVGLGSGGVGMYQMITKPQQNATKKLQRTGPLLGATALGLSLGIPALILGIRGMIRMFKKIKNEPILSAAATEKPNEVATQTESDSATQTDYPLTSSGEAGTN